MKYTVDSNVLIYAVDVNDAAKRTIALDLIRRSDGINLFLSSQVLGEFLTFVRRRRPEAYSELKILATEWALQFSVVSTSSSHVLHGAEIAERYKLQYWDSVILAVAAEEKAEVLLTEDMQDGQRIEGVQILNPFNPQNSPVIERLS